MNDNERKRRIENIYNELKVINDEVKNKNSKNDKKEYLKYKREFFKNIKNEIENIKNDKKVKDLKFQKLEKLETKNIQQLSFPSQPQINKNSQISQPQIVQPLNKEKEVNVNNESLFESFVKEFGLPFITGGITLIFGFGFIMLTGYNIKGRKVVK